MSNRIFTVVLMTLMFLCVQKSQAQSNEINETIRSGTYSSDWILYKQLSHVDIFYRYTDCGETNNNCCEFVFLKFQNKSGLLLNVKWDLFLGWEANFDGKITKIDMRKVSIKLAPGATLFTGCNKSQNDLPLLIVREKLNPNHNVLSEVEFKKLTEKVIINKN